MERRKNRLGVIHVRTARVGEGDIRAGGRIDLLSVQPRTTTIPRPQIAGVSNQITDERTRRRGETAAEGTLKQYVDSSIRC